MMYSVVICTFNRAEIVGGAISSVLAQTFTDFELIVVNDGSSDHTADVLKTYVDPRMQAVNQENGGLSAARNTGIGRSKGRFVIFLDDDDRVLPQWLERLTVGVVDNTGMTSCTTLRVPTGNDRQPVRQNIRSHEFYPEVKGAFVAGSFALDRELLTEVGGFAEEIRVSHQTEVLLRVLPVLFERGMTTTVIDEPLVEIEWREAVDRPLSQPIDLLDGAEYMLANHHELLATRPNILANYQAIAGVNAAKVGRWNVARRHLARAIWSDRRNPSHLGRFLIALVPPLARRKWTLTD